MTSIASPKWVISTEISSSKEDINKLKLDELLQLHQLRYG